MYKNGVGPPPPPNIIGEVVYMSYTKKCNFTRKCNYKRKCFTRKCNLNLFFDKQFSTSVISYTIGLQCTFDLVSQLPIYIKNSACTVGVRQQQTMVFASLQGLSSNLPSLYWMMLSAAGIHLSRAVPPPTTIPSSTAALGRGESASLLTFL